MQKNIVKRHVANKAFQHNAELHLPFPQQLPVITAPEEPPQRRWDKVQAAREGQSRAGTAGPGQELGKSCAYKAATPMHTNLPKPREGLQHHSGHRAASSPSSLQASRLPPQLFWAICTFSPPPQHHKHLPLLRSILLLSWEHGPGGNISRNSLAESQRTRS